MSANSRVVLSNLIVPTHYDLTLTPDLDALTFKGSQIISLHVVEENIKSVTLHSKEIQVISASVTNDEKILKLVGISYDFSLNTVQLAFDESFPIGKCVLNMDFHGVLNGDMAGFYRSYYTDANGAKKVMASTQFESLDARRAFPCWDEPAVKATFGVTIIVPSFLTVLSNMPEKSSTHLSGNKKKVVFHTSPKMSTYLLAWAIGEFDFVEGSTKGGVSIRVFSPPGRAEQGLFALDVGIRSLDFYDAFFKVPYPLPKLDMICITEFAMGAMENWGLVTYRETALMIDDKKASSQSKQRVAIVVAHELAHQWFGNLVTMSWWDGLWLNEGFAAFMEHFAVDALFPDYKIWEQYTTDAYGAAQRLDALKSSHPIIVPIKHAEEVEQVFDAISYCKGSTVVNMVAAVLGKEKFQEGLQLYMSRHAYGNTETIDLWNAWSEVSGKDVASLMSTWTLETGYPYLTVISEKWSNDKVELTLRQSRFLSDGSTVEAEGGNPIWKIPLLFASSGAVSSEAVVMDQVEQTFTIPLAGNEDWIKINTGQKALARVAHSQTMISRLSKAIAKKEVSAVDRAALLLDGYALAKAGLAPLETVIDILRALEATNEASSIVWGAMAAVMNGFFVLLEQLGNEAIFKEYTAFGKRLVVKALLIVGWDAVPNESHTDKLMRATILGLLDIFAWDDEAVAKEAKRRFNLHWTDPSALPAEYKTTVYKIVLMNGGLDEFEEVLKSYRSTEDNQERKHAMFSLGATRDRTLKTRAMDWALKSGEVKMQDVFYPIGSTSSSGAEGAEMAWTYYKENFTEFKSLLAKASPSLMDACIVNSINRFCTISKADEIEKFFEANPLPSSQRRISQSIEVIRSSAQMLAMIQRSPLATVEYWK
eukprot:gene9699-13056_t